MTKEVKERSLLELKSIRDILLEERDWMIDGKDCQWSYQVSLDGNKLIIKRW